MSKCFIEGMGGGSAKLFAAIGVTYPAGSTLTCTNGTKTLTAKTTSGQWVFAIPEAGTWTVTSTDGTNSKSQSVSITTEGQWESVALSYALVLFDGGDNTDVTGGWMKTVDLGCTINVSDTLYIKVEGSNSNYTYGSLTHTANKIDLSDVDTLICVAGSARCDINSWNFGVLSSLPDVVFSISYATSISFTTPGTYSVDVSALSGEYYVGLSTSFAGSYLTPTNEVNITSIKGE